MKVKGFTPVMDSIRAEVGRGAADTYGVMWRYAKQHPMLICTARQKKIAERAGVSRDTVIKDQKALEEHGYITHTGSSTGGVKTWACNVDITGEVRMDVEYVDTPVEFSDTPISKESMKERTAEAIESCEGREHEPSMDVQWLPADIERYLVPFAMWFWSRYTRQVTKTERGLWIREAREWRERGYKPEQVMLAVEHCEEAEITIKSPRSITWAFDQINSVEDDETFSLEM